MKKVLTVLWIIISVISISAVRESSEVKEIINNKVIEDFGKAGLFDEVRNATFSEKEKRILNNPLDSRNSKTFLFLYSGLS